MATQTINFESDQDIADICASFQEAVADTLQERLARSLDRFKSEFPEIAEPVLVVAGGVAANQRTARDADEPLQRRTATVLLPRRWRCAPTMPQ
jgi:N6-L-threonylcarbamoyladenine synthase